MATTWERLAGDTSRFAIKIAFCDDPDPRVGCTPEESLSWGSFQIWVKDRNLCANQFGGEIVLSAHWYLLPLLEWWVANWDPIFHEERLPNENAGADSQASLEKTSEAPRGLADDAALVWEQNWHDWWARHCTEASRTGGIFPSICLRRWREKVEISWNGIAAPARPAGVQFLEASGSARLPANEVAVPLHSVLVEAISHLLGRCPSSERLRSLQARALELSSGGEDRLAWLLGLGGALPEMRKSWAAVREAVECLPEKVRSAILGPAHERGLVFAPFPAALMFGAVSPDLSSSDRVELLRGLGDAYGGARGRVDELAADKPVEDEDTWAQGYELAEDILSVLASGREAYGAVDVRAILNELGVAVAETTLEDRWIRAVAIAGEGYRATILLNRAHSANSYPTGVRFSLAHELCHLLYDRAFAREVALPSGPWAPRDVERRANSFAAMLLMPLNRVLHAIGGSRSPRGSRGLVLDVAKSLDTSFTATVEHMRNLGLLSDEERDALLDEAMDLSGRLGL